MGLWNGKYLSRDVWGELWPKRRVKKTEREGGGGRNYTIIKIIIYCIFTTRSVDGKTLFPESLKLLNLEENQLTDWMDILTLQYLPQWVKFIFTCGCTQVYINIVCQSFVCSVLCVCLHSSWFRYYIYVVCEQNKSLENNSFDEIVVFMNVCCVYVYIHHDSCTVYMLYVSKISHLKIIVLIK